MEDKQVNHKTRKLSDELERTPEWGVSTGFEIRTIEAIRNLEFNLHEAQKAAEDAHFLLTAEVKRAESAEARIKELESTCIKEFEKGYDQALSEVGVKWDGNKFVKKNGESHE